MSKTLRYIGPFNLPLLLDELLAAFPAWLVAGPDGPRCLAALDGTPSTALLTVPDEADERTIAAIVAAHDPAARTRAELQREQVIGLAGGAAGKRLVDLTPAEVRALLAVLLWKNGAINETLRVRALDEWT